MWGVITRSQLSLPHLAQCSGATQLACLVLLYHNKSTEYYMFPGISFLTHRHHLFCKNVCNFLLVHNSSWLRPDLSWHCKRGNLTVDAVSLRLFKIYGSHGPVTNKDLGISVFYQLSDFYELDINRSEIILRLGSIKNNFIKKIPGFDFLTSTGDSCSDFIY